jgi:hypothetical protein
MQGTGKCSLFSRLNYMGRSKLFNLIKDVPSHKVEGGPHIKHGG